MTKFFCLLVVVLLVCNSGSLLAEPSDKEILKQKLTVRDVSGSLLYPETFEWVSKHSNLHLTIKDVEELQELEAERKKGKIASNERSDFDPFKDGRATEIKPKARDVIDDFLDGKITAEQLEAWRVKKQAELDRHIEMNSRPAKADEWGELIPIQSQKQKKDPLEAAIAGGFAALILSVIISTIILIKKNFAKIKNFIWVRVLTVRALVIVVNIGLFLLGLSMCASDSGFENQSFVAALIMIPPTICLTTLTVKHLWPQA